MEIKEERHEHIILTVPVNRNDRGVLTQIGSLKFDNERFSDRQITCQMMYTEDCIVEMNPAELHAFRRAIDAFDNVINPHAA